jgi:hypothetical protein
MSRYCILEDNDSDMRDQRLLFQLRIFAGGKKANKQIAVRERGVSK